MIGVKALIHEGLPVHEGLPLYIVLYKDTGRYVPNPENQCFTATV